jgi:hypothetical protein
VLEEGVLAGEIGSALELSPPPPPQAARTSAAAIAAEVVFNVLFVFMCFHYRRFCSRPRDLLTFILSSGVRSQGNSEARSETAFLVGKLPLAIGGARIVIPGKGP